MKSLLRYVLLCAALAVAGGCSGRSTVLHVGLHPGSLKPERIARFEREQGCRVVMDTPGSDQALYAKLKAGGSGYDVVSASSYWVTVLRREGLLQPLRRELVPNLANLDPEYGRLTADAECTHSVPYRIGSVGLAFRKSKMPDFAASWAMLDRRDLAGRMTLLAEPRETIGAALKVLGHSLNTTNDTELAEARDVVVRWKKNLARFGGETPEDGIVSGALLVAHGRKGDVLRAMEENDDVAYAVPQEGVSLPCDELAIPAGARQAELAHAFINYLHDPRVAAENTEFAFLLCPNLASYPLLPDEIRDDATIFLPAGILRNSEVVRDLGADNAKYARLWTEIIQATPGD